MMLIRVNRRITPPKSVEFDTLHSGTVSHVWHDEESDSSSKPKRRNRIRMKHRSDEPNYDA